MRALLASRRQVSLPLRLPRLLLPLPLPLKDPLQDAKLVSNVPTVYTEGITLS